MQQHEEEPWHARLMQEREGNVGQQKRRREQVPKMTGILSLEAWQLQLPLYIYIYIVLFNTYIYIYIFICFCAIMQIMQ